LSEFCVAEPPFKPEPATSSSGSVNGPENGHPTTVSSQRPFLRRLIWIALSLLLGLLLVGAIAPFVNASEFSEPIRRALEAWLGRRVAFQAVHFTLFSGPGFTLENVLIYEDPRYGVEPFAYVPSLDARVRWDKLLTGKIRFSSLRLEEPSLNFVRQTDGTWNVVDLLHRLEAANLPTLNLFPAFEVSDGRIDFRLGTRKTTFYMEDSDLSIFPDRSGDLSIQFSGWPARTDRAGMGFGHLRGTAHWHARPHSGQQSQLNADLTLDPSNLSELTTLFEGHDAGIHGTVSSHMHIEGPANALQISGDLQLEDVHRWDLLASNSPDWHIRYTGRLDLAAHHLEMQAPADGSRGENVPLQLSMKVDHLLGLPEVSLDALLNGLPANRALPVLRRMGMPLPQTFALSGVLSGTVSYATGKGLSGAIVMQHVSASVSDEPRFQTEMALATISSGHFHVEPALIQQAGGGTLEAGGDYDFSTGSVTASFKVDQFSAAHLKRTFADWFGSPAALAALEDGKLTGELVYQQAGAERSITQEPSWSGSLQMAGAIVKLPVLAQPLRACRGRLSFDAHQFSLTHFSGRMGATVVNASYRYNENAELPEQLRMEMDAADLDDIQAALAPVLRPSGLLARLRFTKRHVPSWLATRSLEADVAIRRFSVQGAELGPLHSHLIWKATQVRFTSIQLRLANGFVDGLGAVDLATDTPRYQLSLNAQDLPWKGGLLNAVGEVTTSGFGAAVLANLRASGSFSAENIRFSADDFFETMEGKFALSLADSRPDLRLSSVAAANGADIWTGEASVEEDGKLVLHLVRDSDQRRIVSALDFPDSYNR